MKDNLPLLAGGSNGAEMLERLGAWLQEEGVVSQQQLVRSEKVARESGERLDHVLTRLGFASDRVIADGFCATLNVARAKPDDFVEDPPLLDELGLRFLSAARVMTLALDADGLHVAVADPINTSALDAICLKTGHPVVMSIGVASEIETALESHARARALERGDADLGEPSVEDTAADVARLKDIASEAPVIRIVNQLIRRAVEARASDIHVEPADQALRVRIRVDGDLVDVEPPPPHLRAAVVSRIKIMAQINIAEQRLPQDGRIKATVAGRDIDLRVATLPTLLGESIVLRLLDRSGLTLTFDGLGFSPDAATRMHQLIRRPNGILLVTGPTGSGKTTTLYAALSQLNTPERKIITVEDPVEYRLESISQIQVKPQIGLGFAESLRAILRQNPDIIMIGEIRDRETAEIAVQAALTGHLVLATLHTNSAAAAINRLRDMGVEDYLIAATVVGVLGQRLVRKLCLHCGVLEEPELVRRLVPDASADQFRAAEGCSDCRGTGYRGRTGVHEVLIVNDDVRRAVLQRADHRDIEAMACETGMATMRDDALSKATVGETSLSEVLRIATET